MSNIYTDFSADWEIFRYINVDTTSVTETKLSQNYRVTESETYKLLVISLFRSSENPRKQRHKTSKEYV